MEHDNPKDVIDPVARDNRAALLYGLNQQVTAIMLSQHNYQRVYGSVEVIDKFDEMLQFTKDLIASLKSIDS